MMSSTSLHKITQSSTLGKRYPKLATYNVPGPYENQHISFTVC